MTIEINNQANSPRLNAREDLSVQTRGSEKGGKTQPESASIPSDTVSLTETAAMMQKIQDSLSRIPVVDTGRVESIKAAIADGSYKMDSEVLADKLSSFERQLAESL